MEFQDGFYWHPWHQGGPLWYMTADEARRRSKFINSNKPEVERPERNRLFQLADVSTIPAYVKARAAYDKAGAAYVKARAALDKARAALDKAGAALDKARAAYDKAGAAYDKAGAAYDKARAALDKAGAAYVKARAALDKARAAYVKARAALDKARAASEVIALHAAQCGCRWTPEHPNIFEDSRD